MIESGDQEKKCLKTLNLLLSQPVSQPQRHKESKFIDINFFNIPSPPSWNYVYLHLSLPLISDGIPNSFVSLTSSSFQLILFPLTPFENIILLRYLFLPSRTIQSSYGIECVNKIKKVNLVVELQTVLCDHSCFSLLTALFLCLLCQYSFLGLCSQASYPLILNAYHSHPSPHLMSILFSAYWTSVFGQSRTQASQI